MLAIYDNFMIKRLQQLLISLRTKSLRNWDAITSIAAIHYTTMDPTVHNLSAFRSTVCDR